MEQERAKVIKRTQLLFFVAAAFCLSVWIVYVFFEQYTIATIWNFEGQKPQETGSGVKVIVRVDTRVKPSTLAGMKIWATSTRPYNLEVGFWTDGNASTVRTAIVERLKIKYDNGEEINIIKPERKQEWPFTIRRTSNWDGSGLVYQESLEAAGTLTNCIDKNVAFSLECQGVVIPATGKQESFEVRWNYRPKRLNGILPNYLLDPAITESPFAKP